MSWFRRRPKADPSTVARAVSRALDTALPTTLFTVTTRPDPSVPSTACRVIWFDGPTPAQVDAALGEIRDEFGKRSYYLVRWYSDIATQLAAKELAISGTAKYDWGTPGFQRQVSDLLRDQPLDDFPERKTGQDPHPA